MAYNTKEIVKDAEGNPISQYFNPDEDRYEPVEGKAGANKVILCNSDGSINNSLSLIPILDKLSQLTGTVIDEETRKSNELQRIALYNQILQMLNDGELKGDKGDIGKGLEFNWQGTQLGIRVEGDTEYIYVDLRGPEGPQGPPGTIENLTKQHVVNAVGYLPVKSVNDILPDGNGNIVIEIGPDLQSQIGDINDPALPTELKGKALTEQTKYIFENAGGVKSVNDKTGDVTLTANDVGAVPTSRKVNNKVLTADISLTASDVGAVPTTRTVNNKPLSSNIAIDVPDIQGLRNVSLALGYDAVAANFSVALGASALSSMYSVALGQGAYTPNQNEGILGTSSNTKNWKVPGSFTVSGTKNFEIPHPHPDKKATHVIRHAAVESPTAGDTLYRYTITATDNNQTVEMQLPDYFQYLNKNVDVWVNGHKHFGRAFGEVEGDTLKVTCELAGKYKVLVIGTRNDDHQSVQDWDIKGVEREIGESWTGETYVFEVDEIMEIDEIKEVA